MEIDKLLYVFNSLNFYNKVIYLSLFHVVLWQAFQNIAYLQKMFTLQKPDYSHNNMMIQMYLHSVPIPGVTTYHNNNKKT